ncbi:type II and III secretion system protein [Psychrobacter sp. ANT_WB68]|uniref:type II and III secretion system protein n=1 Tax=Psychrobacter sp. ANT_WB68 TaxID=2597355 RepID=UPI0011F29B08|nr:type II and III secretion system protein [Psychrobacter sp. ANT_WB68]KAA0913434.1 type II and III secretion system protein [Psychrobacter sp. ANT_WB68]
MNKFSENLIASFGRTVAILNTIKNIKTARSISYARSIAFALSLASLPIVVQAAAYQTYVIHTYGGESLLPAVRQQLDASRDGGTVTTYQDKLILHTTAVNYQTVQQLLRQIDGQSQALTVAVRVGSNSDSQSNIQQGQVIISNRGIQGAGVINQRNSQQQGNNLYQVQTLSGSAASISTGTLYSLSQTHIANSYPAYNRSSGQIVIQQQVLLPTTQGIAVTPRLLPNGQVEVTLTQVEEQLVRANPSYNRYGYNNNSSVQGQRLNSTIIVPRGQWVNIGQISQNNQTQSSGYGSNRTLSSSNSVPISLLVQ